MSVRGAIFTPVSAALSHTLDVAHLLAVDVFLHKSFDRTEGQKHDGWFWLPVLDDVIRHMCRAYTGSTTAGATPNYLNARRKPNEVCAAVSDTLNMLISLVLSRSRTLLLQADPLPRHGRISSDQCIPRGRLQM